MRKRLTSNTKVVKKLSLEEAQILYMVDPTCVCPFRNNYKDREGGLEPWLQKALKNGWRPGFDQKPPTEKPSVDYYLIEDKEDENTPPFR